MSPPGNNELILPRLEHSGPARRRTFWIGLATVWLFAASFLQFARLDSMAAPAAERVNNGRRPTFFALFINPYYLYAEDFHLYAVRSKRILDRGWTDSPLYRTEKSQASYRAPFQAGLMMLGEATEGRPIPYSIFVVGVLATSWTVLYVAAARWLPRSMSPITPLIAVVVTALFESPAGLMHWSGEYYSWPPHRALRMATLAWSNPLTLALIIAAASLVVRPRQSAGRLAFVGVILCLLAAGDTWSFTLAAAAIGLLLVALGIAFLLSPRFALERRPIATAAGGLAVGIAAASLIHLTTSGFSGDALTRAGFGTEWVTSPLGFLANWPLRKSLRRSLLWLGVAILTAGLYVTLRPDRAGRALRGRVLWFRPTATRAFLIALAGSAVAGVVISTAALGRIGMEGYHANQFLWRCDYVLLFVVVVFISETIKRLIRRFSRSRRASRRWEIASAAALLSSLLIYHNVRIDKFLRRTAAFEFFLTDDAEHLGDWLQRQRRSRGEFSLATLSHELNYLCAFWTNADLLLPEGFPLHSAESDAEIESRMARLLRVYNVDPQDWIDFNLHHQTWDHWSWPISRVLAARHGYSYYLLHRTYALKGDMSRAPTPLPQGGATARVAVRLEADRQNVLNDLVGRRKSAVASVARIAERLAEVSDVEPSERPEVIVIDDVSRALGTPNFDGYVREFQHGAIEAWVLKETQLGEADAP